MLHNLPACEQSVVVKHVAETLEGMLHVASSDENDSPIEHFALVTKRIQYIEVLMENFRPGETALKQQLPQGICMSSMYCFIIEMTVSHHST